MYTDAYIDLSPISDLEELPEIFLMRSFYRIENGTVYALDVPQFFSWFESDNESPERKEEILRELAHPNNSAMMYAEFIDGKCQAIQIANLGLLALDELAHSEENLS